MKTVRETIIVEGKYDRQRLLRAVRANVVETSGFRIFNDTEKRALIKKLAEKTGVVILTDSDSAGFLIRNHLKGVLDKDTVKHAYIPRMPGKEKRKSTPSREGVLGVEGMGDGIILDALRRAGVSFDDGYAPDTRRAVTKADLYEDGLSGREESGARRARLTGMLELPGHITVNALLDVINILYTFEEYKRLVSEIE